MDNPHAMVTKSSFRQDGVNIGTVANEEKRRDALISLQRLASSLDNYTTPLISTHDIYGNSHR